LSGEIIEVDGTSLAQRAGNVRTMNTVMLGALAATGKLPFPIDALKEAISENVPPKTIDVNIRALELGLTASKRQDD
jgi:indolepyruvate ferredoxin oxidoreductase beta subunit